MTTGEIVVMGLFLILGLNAAVYALRLFFLLLQNRTAPFFTVFIGFWPRVLSGDLDGLDQGSAKEFLSLRRSIFISMVAGFVILMAGLTWLSQ
mgnify:CR=1 FL=1